jgi:hypothetical protein
MESVDVVVAENYKMKKYGTRAEVGEGKAEKTRGGLTRDSLIKNKRNKWVSKKRSEASIKEKEKIVEKLNQGRLKKKESVTTEEVSI